MAACGGPWRALAEPGGPWRRFLAPLGALWRPLAAPGGSWRSLAPSGWCRGLRSGGCRTHPPHPPSAPMCRERRWHTAGSLQSVRRYLRGGGCRTHPPHPPSSPTCGWRRCPSHCRGSPLRRRTPVPRLEVFVVGGGFGRHRTHAAATRHLVVDRRCGGVPECLGAAFKAQAARLAPSHARCRCAGMPIRYR